MLARNLGQTAEVILLLMGRSMFLACSDFPPVMSCLIRWTFNLAIKLAKGIATAERYGLQEVDHCLGSADCGRRAGCRSDGWATLAKGHLGVGSQYVQHPRRGSFSHPLFANFTAFTGVLVAE